MFLGHIGPPHPVALVTEYCANGSLFEFIRKHVTVTNEWFCSVFIGVAKGMIHLHGEKVIHRDLAGGKFHGNFMVDGLKLVIYC